MLYQLVFSPTGGTERVANALTAHIDSDFKTVDLSSVKDDFSR